MRSFPDYLEDYLHVGGLQKLHVPTPDALLVIQAETVPTLAVVVETSPPRLIRPAPSQSYDFSSTTSIAPRERPKAANPSASALVLPPPPSKFGTIPLTPINVQSSYSSESVPSATVSAAAPTSVLSNPVLIDITTANSSAIASHSSPFQPIPGVLYPFRSGEVLNGSRPDEVSFL